MILQPKSFTIVRKRNDNSSHRFRCTARTLPQDEGMQVDDAKFMGLSKKLEFAIGAIIILILNLAVDSGLMNGSQGTIVDIIYATGILCLLHLLPMMVRCCEETFSV